MKLVALCYTDFFDLLMIIVIKLNLILNGIISKLVIIIILAILEIMIKILSFFNSVTNFHMEIVIVVIIFLININLAHIVVALVHIINSTNFFKFHCLIEHTTMKIIID